MNRTMMRTIGAGFIAALLAVVPIAAQKPEAAETLLQTAIKKEVVDGNLPGAIEGYKKALAAAKGNRAIAAQALVHMAECYQKAGDAQARKIYEQIVQDYSDQKEALRVAQAHLGANGSGTETARVQRRIPTGPTVTGDATPSPDGRFLGYVDWETGGNVAIYDLSSGREHALTQDAKPGADDYAANLAFTPDSRNIIYQWSVHGGDKTEIRIIDIDGSGKRSILSDSKYPYKYVEPTAVSPDGKLIAAGLWFEDKTAKIALVSLDTGSVRILRSVEWHNPSIGNFSPDGKWLVYNSALRQGSPTAASPDAEIYALATDGSALEKLVPGPVNRVFAPRFTPDGSRIVFAVNRAGARELWSMPVANGRKLDEPRLEIHSGRLVPLGFTQAGTFYFYTSEHKNGIFVVDVDPNTLKAKASPKLISNPLRSDNVAASEWSPDGKLLAYLSDPVTATGPNDSTPRKLVIHDLASDEESEITYQGNFRGWFDNSSVLANGIGFALHLVDVRDGKDRIWFDERIGRPTVSRDGRTLFHFTRDTDLANAPASDTVHLMRRDVDTRQDKELCRMEAKNSAPDLMLPSPDNHWLVFTITRPADQGPSVWLVNSSGGTPREIHFPKERRNAGVLAWTADSKGLLFVGPGASGTEIWMQPLDGGPVYATGVVMPQISSISMSADGRHIAFLSRANDNQEGQSGVWAVQNLLARTSPSKK